MDHDEVLEALEIAAAEPGGLDRLMAGDTPTAVVVAGHLAGCPACTAELGRLGRDAAVIRDAIATTPSPDLRDRTLAHVRAHGAPRAAPTSQPSEAPEMPVTSAMPIAAPRSAEPAQARRRALAWLSAIAAAVALAVVATSWLAGARFDEGIAAQDETIEHLAAVTKATLALTAEPDVASVPLTSPAGGPTKGTLLFSPSTTELVVVATGLTEPGGDSEYRCWVLVDGVRMDIGKMFFGGDLAYWIGASPEVAGLGPDEAFGVSLVDASGSISDPDPVLSSGS